MSFVQPEFPVFLAAVVALYWCLGRRMQNVLLLGASFLFYGWVHPWFVGLLLLATFFAYGGTRALVRWPERRRLILWLAVGGNLAVLAAFKYFDFFIGTAQTALAAVGLRTDPHTLGLLLPAGISFYTFQVIAYVVDVSRGKVEARSSLLDVALFVSFFPLLLAGPIERASHLLTQLERPRTIDRERFASGLSLALWGAFKKVVIADTVALAVGASFSQADPSAAMIWAASVAFSVQLLADFSGYTDIARGSARMLGIDLVENFDRPFLSTSPSEWWTRWHMSFSSWMRDYVFQPLALAPWFRRLSLPRASIRSHGQRALLVTMMLGGLWHGASWNFVLWGALFGVLQWIWVEVGIRLPRSVRTWSGGRWVLVALMFVVSTFSSMLFREQDVSRIVGYLTSNPFAGTPAEWTAAIATLSIAVVGASPMVAMWAFRTWGRPVLQPVWILPLRTTAWTAAVWSLFTFGGSSRSAFVYFQF